MSRSHSTRSLCKVCGNTKSVVIRDTLRHGIRRNVLQCTACAFVFLEPRAERSTAYYSGTEYRKMYGPVVKKSSTPKEIFDMYLPFQARIIDEFRKVLRPDMKVLDVGCSTGHLLAALKGKVKQRVGVELNRREANFVRATQKIRVYSEPIETVQIAEGPFDLVVSSRVLEHVTDPLIFLRSIVRQVKPGGYVYLEVPNLDDVMLTLLKETGYADFSFREPHRWYFSPKTLKLLLAKAGFRGAIKTAQRYNVLNAMHWIATGKPQGSFVIGNRIPKLVADGTDHRVARQDLNRFIQRADAEYKRILQKHGLGDALFFFGKVGKTPERRT